MSQTDAELREQISDILDDFGHEVVNQAYDSRFSLLGKHEHKLMQLIKARNTTIRIEAQDDLLREAAKKASAEYDMSEVDNWIFAFGDELRDVYLDHIKRRESDQTKEEG